MYMFNYSRDHFGNQEQVFEVDFFQSMICYSNSQNRRTASTKMKSDDICSAIYIILTDLKYCFNFIDTFDRY